MISIAFLPVDGFALMSFAAASEPLRAANLLAGRRLYEIRTLPVAGAAAVASNGATVPRDGPDSPPDIAFVVAAGDPFAVRDRRLFDRLRQWGRAGVTLGGVSGGPVILARAGLMNGRRMAVHWEHAAPLAEAEPAVLLERSLFVIDRDRITCAGGAAPMDMMHHLIARDHGAAFARQVSDWFHHTEVRPETGAQRSGAMARWGVRAAPVADAIEMMEIHLADPLSLTQLAGITGVSARHLNRLFRDERGTTAMAFYLRLRLEQAKRMLETTPLGLKQVAEATGFASVGHFSTRFSRAFGMAPSLVVGG